MKSVERVISYRSPSGTSVPEQPDPLPPYAVRRTGRRIILPPNSELPCDSCFKCGEPATHKKLHKLTWQSGESLAIGLVALAASAPSLSATWDTNVQIGLCRHHRNHYLGWTLVTVLGFPSLLAAGIASMWHDQLWLGFGLIVASLLLPLIGFIFGRVVRAGKISDNGVELLGAGRKFRESFPVDR